MPPRRKATRQPKPKPALLRPRDYIVKGQQWPQGPLAAHAPKEARLVRGIATKFLYYRDKRNTTINEIARSTGLGHQTLYNLRDGESWPNLITIARLEIFFQRRLWGNEHKPR